MDVIEQHEHRLLPRQTLNLPQQRLVYLLLLALGGDIEEPAPFG
jgi:hypothetical protein